MNQHKLYAHGPECEKMVVLDSEANSEGFSVLAVYPHDHRHPNLLQHRREHVGSLQPREVRPDHPLDVAQPGTPASAGTRADHDVVRPHQGGHLFVADVCQQAVAEEPASLGCGGGVATVERLAHADQDLGTRRCFFDVADFFGMSQREEEVFREDLPDGFAFTEGLASEEFDSGYGVFAVSGELFLSIPVDAAEQKAILRYNGENKV